MGKHKEWRKIAKRERRRKLRIICAKERDEDEFCNTLENNELLKLEIEHIEQTNEQENSKWLQAEMVAMKRWQILQEELQKAQQQELAEKTRMKLEWEMEQQRKKEEEVILKQKEKELMEKQQIFMESLEKFLAGSSSKPPKELLVLKETKPNTDLCPFFYKTSCCRFGDQCSRNHTYPGISKVLLATNFYIHFGLNNAASNEYDTDIMLEYDDGDTYKEFENFFYDVLTEFQKFGEVVQFKVCNNFEKHLRGNSYVEFSELRSAGAAYRALHSRWYGGRQLSLQFCHIESWKKAICGSQLRGCCPKGRSCNFLHVFRNPKNLFSLHPSARSRRSPPRTWRWSESPEVEIKENADRSADRSRRRRRRSRSRDRRREDKSDDKRRRRSRSGARSSRRD